jgi:hypothetical protein
VATTVVFGDTADRQIDGSNAASDYSVARETAVTLASAALGSIAVGQSFVTTTYTCREGFFGFDTSTIAGTISAATLALDLNSDSSAVDFIVEARLHDWGTAVDLTDWVAGSQLSTKTLLATLDTSTLGGTGAYYDFTSDSAFPANINQSGFTRLVLASSNQRLASAPGASPGGNEFVTWNSADNVGTTLDPKLTVTFTPIVTLSGTVTATIGETDIVAGGKTIILTVAGDTYIAAGVDSKVSALAAVSAVAGTNEFLVNEAGTSKKASATQLATFCAPSFASQAEQETGTDVVKAVSPGRQHFHASANKFWVKATGDSTTIVVSYNMTSWADTGPGVATGTIDTDFSSANWCGQVSVLDSTSAWDATFTVGAGFATQAAGTFRVDSSRMQDGNTAAAALNDPDSWLVSGFGDL